MSAISRKAEQALDPLWDWKLINPDYQTSPPRVSKCGRFVEIDGGKSSEMAAFGRTVFFTQSKRTRK